MPNTTLPALTPISGVTRVDPSANCAWSRAGSCGAVERRSSPGSRPGRPRRDRRARWSCRPACSSPRRSPGAPPRLSAPSRRTSTSTGGSTAAMRNQRTALRSSSVVADSALPRTTTPWLSPRIFPLVRLPSASTAPGAAIPRGGSPFADSQGDPQQVRQEHRRLIEETAFVIARSQGAATPFASGEDQQVGGEAHRSDLSEEKRCPQTPRHRSHPSATLPPADRSAAPRRPRRPPPPPRARAASTSSGRPASSPRDRASPCRAVRATESTGSHRLTDR